jgi:hypothetical protein
MSDLLRVTDGAEITLDGLVVDLGNPGSLAEFMPDPALRQCVSGHLPEFYDPAVDRLVTLDCSRHGIYHLGGLEYLQALRSVDLSNNLLEDNDVQVLKQLSPTVATVDVTGNKLSFASIAELQTHFEGTATFLPAGPAPVLPSIALTTTDTDFEVSWQADPSVTRYDLLYRFDSGVYRSVSNVTPPVSISLPGAIDSYGVRVIVTNDLGSDSIAEEQSVP